MLTMGSGIAIVLSLYHVTLFYSTLTKEVLLGLSKRGNRCLKKLNNLLKESEMTGLSPNPRLSDIIASVLNHHPVGRFSSNEGQTE